MFSEWIIVVGRRKSGKTTFCLETIKNLNKESLFIYDINNDYKEFFNYPFLKYEDFIEVAECLKKTFFVFEEATIYLNNRGTSPKLLQILIRSRHTGNSGILVFHSIRSVPLYIYELCNYLVLFKTNDVSEATSRELKDERIKEAFYNLKKNPDPHAKIIINI